MLILGAEITNPLQITAIGVLIAILFLASIVGVRGWMLRLPKETEQRRIATKAVRSVNKLGNILVPLLGRNEATDRIVALAAQMARQRNGRVEFLAVIQVPFTLPLNAHVEQDGKVALEALECAESVAAQCGGRNGVQISKRILKARDIGAAVVHEAEEQLVDLVLLANTPVRVRGSMQQIDPAIEYVMRNAPCEVLVLSQGRTSARSNSIGDTAHEPTTVGASI